MKKLIGSLIALPLLTAGVVVGASSAQAANITHPVPGPGFVNIYAIASPAGAGNGVTVKISGGNVTFDFAPAPPSNYNVSLATDAFSQFGGSSGSIKNVTVPTIGGSVNIPSFLNLDNVGGDSSFTLKTVSAPLFSFVPGIGTIVNIGVTGEFIQAPGKIFHGSGLFSATFVGQTQAQILAAAAGPGITTSWSATFNAFKKTVPEPSNVAGLIVFAGVSTLLLKRRQKA